MAQAPVNRPSKVCAGCGQRFEKNPKLSYAQWEQKRFCSNECGCLSRRCGQIDKDGRVKVWTSSGLRWRYHVVAEEMLGRPLSPGEVVDHINGDCADDRPENLRVFASHAEHMRNHWREGTIKRAPGPGGSEKAVAA